MPFGLRTASKWCTVHKFISFFQVRSLAAESDKAYQGGPLERTFYREAYLAPEEGGNVDVADFQLPNQYANRLDWFAVDLEGEHSAMDGRILEEHTEYVVYAIHRVSLLSFELFYFCMNSVIILILTIWHRTFVLYMAI